MVRPPNGNRFLDAASMTYWPDAPEHPVHESGQCGYCDIKRSALVSGGGAEKGQPLPWVYDDGGREAAGFTGRSGDCVTRAIAIATGFSYRIVYDALNEEAKRERPRNGRKRSSSRTGVHRRTFGRYLDEVGFTWHPTMQIGSGCTTHLAIGEVPMDGRHVMSLSRHVCAVVNGVVLDTSDPGRGGTRCVYGYWSAPVWLSTEGAS
jgi:hypothetical protein